MKLTSEGARNLLEEERKLWFISRNKRKLVKFKIKILTQITKISLIIW